MRILIIISLLLQISILSYGQSLKNRFIMAYETIEIDPDFDGASFKYYGFIYNDIDNIVSDKEYYKIYIYFGNEKIYFCHDKTRNGKMYYKLPPNLREYYFSKLSTQTIDSVEYWNIKTNNNVLLGTIIPDDANFFIDYYIKRFSEDLINNLALHDINYFIEICKPRYVGWEESFYKIFPNAKK